MYLIIIMVKWKQVIVHISDIIIFVKFKLTFEAVEDISLFLLT